jgi:hypothetical protein
MDLEELRLNCLRMAHELGGKSEAVISAANDLLSFVMSGQTAGTHAPEPAATEVAPSEVSAPAAEPAVADRIAACGTALEMPESGDLAEAEPVVEVEAAAEAEPVSPAEATEAVPAQATAEDAETLSAPTAVVEETEPAAASSPEPAEEVAEATSNGSADAAPEVEVVAVAVELAAGASEELATVADEADQGHTAS